MSTVGEGRLANKIALVTGGASGIGRACALRYAEEGADVVVADRDAERGSAVAAEIKTASNRQALYVPVDVAEEASIEAMAATAVEHFGRIDTVLASAGISYANYQSGQPEAAQVMATSRGLLHLKLADWQRVLDVNLTGVMLTNRICARHMVEQSVKGSIVNVASSAARLAIPGAADYCVSKAGVAMLTHVFAMELLEFGIRVNAIGPGFIETPMTAAMREDPERLAAIVGRTPMGRVGTPLEMANAALYLACEESSYTTGHTLYPNGGMFVG